MPQHRVALPAGFFVRDEVLALGLALNPAPRTVGVFGEKGSRSAEMGPGGVAPGSEEPLGGA